MGGRLVVSAVAAGLFFWAKTGAAQLPANTNSRAHCLSRLVQYIIESLSDEDSKNKML
jgi:hypothetical protein